MCMFCFFNLPHKGAKGRSQRQCRELARTSGQIAGLAYHRGEHATWGPSCSLLPSCLQLSSLYPQRVLAGTDTPCLAGTSAQHIQGEPSQISLCYFKPTKDAGPLPQSHKYLSSRPHPRLWGTLLLQLTLLETKAQSWSGEGSAESNGVGSTHGGKEASTAEASRGYR